MEILLDTHVFVWWQASHPRLASSIAALINDRRNLVHVSAASVWEIAIKRRRGRLAFEGSMTQALADAGFDTLACDAADGEAAGGREWAHVDPFDRMIVAQGLRRRLVVVTADRRILAFVALATIAAG
jgi:PIN domain nuclease of toxin-antitoxin system